MSEDRSRAALATRLGFSIAELAALVASAALSAWVYLQTYAAQGSMVPFGSDTTTYIWRARVVGTMGLAALPGSSPFPFQANGANPDRVGLLVLASVFRSVVGVGPWRFMWVLPAVAAIVVAGGAWAFARAMREPRWAAPVYAIAAATSASFAITARGYFDNLLADGMLMAAGVCALLVADRRPGVGAGILLMVAAFVTHWVFGIYLVAVLAGFAVVLLPESIGLRRRETLGWLATPTGRVGAMAVGSVALGGAALLALPGAQHIGHGKHRGFSVRLGRQLPHYRLPLLLPAAAVGAGVLAFGRDRLPRIRGLLLQLVWLAPVGAGAVLFAMGGNVAIQRFVAFAFPLALLAAAALVAPGRLALALPRPWRFVAFPIALMIAVGGAAWSVRNAADALDESLPMMVPATHSVLRTAATYLEDVHADVPVIVVVDGAVDVPSLGMLQAFRRVRAVFPGRVVSRTVVYLGDPEEALAGRRTSRPEQFKFDRVAKTYFSRIGPFVGPESIVLVLQPFNRFYQDILRRHPEWEIATGVLLARGPAPSGPVSVARLPSRPAMSELMTWTLALVALLVACGLGWSRALLRVGWVEGVALAPAFGAASITVVGLLIARAGFAMRGAPMVWAAVVAAAAGVLAWAARSLVERRRPAEPTPDVPVDAPVDVAVRDP
jgi:hypothetical protein